MTCMLERDLGLREWEMKRMPAKKTVALMASVFKVTLFPTAAYINVYTTISM